MSTSSPAPAGAAPAPTVGAAPAPLVDGALAKRFAIVCGVVPAILLGWDAMHAQLGVNGVNFAIRTTGMVGLVLLTLSLGVTPLRRLTGWQWLLAARRNLGVLGFAYIALHFAIFFWLDRAHDVGSTLHEIATRVYLWFGTGSLVIMIPLAITSTDAMVTRLGARRWKALHRLAYVAIAAGVVHFFLLVKADTTRPLAFTIVLAGLLVYRGVRHYLDLRAEVATARSKLTAARAAGPRRPRFWQGELVIARIFDESPDVKTFRLTLPDGGPLPFTHTAGQYLNISTLIDGERVGRSYTIASSPTRTHHVEISVKRAGRFSTHLHTQVREGARVRIGAPAGRFVFAGDEARRVILVGGGVGITPMMSVIRSLTDRCWTGELILLYAARRRADLAFADELAVLAARFPNLRVVPTLSAEPADSDWTGARGHITAALVRAAAPELAGSRVMLCGPAPMMTAMRALFRELGVPDADIHEEAFVSPAAGAAATDASTSAAPADAPTADAPTADAATVEFRRSGRRGELAAGLTVLEAAEDCGVDLPFECRSGICGQCKTALVSGRVAMEVQDALTAADRGRGLILACQARAVTADVVVDA